MKKIAVILGMVLLSASLGVNRGLAQKYAEKQGDGQVKGTSILSEEEILRNLSNRPVLDKGIWQELKDTQRKVGRRIGATQKNGKAEEGYFTTPFVNNFDKKEEYEDNWTLVDRDGDGYSWNFVFHDEWPALDGSTEGGCIYSSFNRQKNVDDWIITKKPVRFTGTQKAYIAFLYAGSSVQTYDIERLAVYCGKENDPAKMDKLEEWEFYGREWRFKFIEVDLSAGDYYFAINACSDKDKLNIFVDEIEIGEGRYGGKSNLVLDYVYLPISSCALDEGEISLLLINRGKTAIERFALSYSVNGGAEVKQEFNTRIPLLDTVKVAFATKADLSEVGTTYKVRVQGEVLETESDVLEELRMEDNEIVDSVVHFEPTELPFITDMNEAEDRAQWGFATGTWSYNPYRVLAIMSEDTMPLVSRCMPLQKDHSYRFTFDYVAGMAILGTITFDENFDVLYGLAGTPIENWTPIKKYENIMTENMLVSDEIVFSPQADGTYAFAIVSRTQWGILYIQKVSITEIMEHDVVLQDWVTRLGRMTPARHAVRPSFEALVANRGMSDETGVKMVIRQGAEIIGESDRVALRRDSLAVFSPIEGRIELPSLNSEVTLNLSVEIPMEDGNPYNNSIDFSFVATDTAYVFDNVPEIPLRGVSSANFALGNIFTLAEQDTLTGVSIAWLDLTQEYSQDFNVAIEVYPVDMQTGRLSSAVLHYEMKRGLSGGFRTAELPAHILSAGSYLIGVRQLGKENMAVAVDEDIEDGYFFIAGSGVYGIQADRGFLGVRAFFGTVHAITAKDIEIRDIELPKEIGAFTANQLIRANYVNHGFESMEVEFKCTVGDQVQTSKKTINGYESGRVSFVADLSKLGQHVITVEALAEGDEDEGNNAKKKEVECVYIDARVMNFEYCDDFAVNGFEPAWKSVDVDGIKPGPHGLTFPNVNAPFGFMAYNSVEAGELDDYTGQVVNVAHGGARCGMSLVTTPASNDWLISPEFAMAESADSLGVSLWVRSSDPDHKEWYNVLVSTTDDKPTSFEIIPGENGAVLREAPGEWTRVWVDLSAYKGKNIYVAIQCVSQDAWMFLIDDIEVKTGWLGNTPVVDLSRYVKSYPNPATDLWTVTAYGLEISRVEICDMAGSVVFRSAGSLATDAYRVNMSGFKPGLYMARVYTNAGLQTLKVVVR